jgi:hypothetical protein
VRPVVEQTGDWSGEKSCAQGQLQAGGNLLNPEDRGKVNGPALTRVDITDETGSVRQTRRASISTIDF